MTESAPLSKGSKYSRQIVQTPSEHAPQINVRFFYNSLINIDDALSPVPSPKTPLSHEGSSSLRPFSGRLLQVTSGCEKSKPALRTKHHCKLTGRPAPPSQREQQTRKTFQQQEHFQRLSGGDSSSHSKALQSQTKNENVSESPNSRSHFTRQPFGTLGSEAFIEGHSETQKSGEGKHLRETSENCKWLDQSTAGTGGSGLTGNPFVRAPSRTSTSTMKEERYSQDSIGNDTALENAIDDNKTPTVAVPVGIARLHQVHMPKLRMDPIYWSTIHDSYPVIRGTWFYKDTMLPVESDIANLLETGYLHLRPWTETWKDELSSAVEVGALGEEKITYALWPVPSAPMSMGNRKPGSIRSSVSPEDEDPAQIRKRIVDWAGSFIDDTSDPDLDNKASGSVNIEKDKNVKLYRNASVIYANEDEATILRPSLAPSAYYGRRPYANYIRKGFKIGIHVVRGFDPGAFKTRNYKNSINPNLTASNRLNAHGCSELQQIQVTDLILVIHGIGQKLSERVESFHFTHAMNAFRREVNAELYNPAMRECTRQGMGNIMVLPVNWRSTLSFEGSAYSDAGSTSIEGEFSLKDITPAELSSIRNIISDVMLDIPYYLSHHQPKIISAVIKEANRIYRLWSKNNPGFSETGRVHLIAHSLGSVIAMDILSRQPTSVTLDDFANELDATNFVFNTTNIFFCGSPAGFFLLLRKAKLLPRRGRKGGLMTDDNGNSTISGCQDTYGCLAVDNIYNIINPYDPVAYHLNATIDATYALSLKPAYVPKSSASWFSWIRTGVIKTSTLDSKPTESTGSVERLPSNVELEIHNFSREEIAERRAYLLNENGQVDYLLRYGGGPLDIQYLTMLSAHSSYWISKDFIKFVVLETSRRPGPDGTLAEIRATKKKTFLP